MSKAKEYIDKLATTIPDDDKILSETSHTIYFKDGTVKLKTIDEDAAKKFVDFLKNEAIPTSKEVLTELKLLNYEKLQIAYDNLIKDKEYAEAEGKRLSEVSTHWQRKYDKLKSDNEVLLKACKAVLTEYDNAIGMMSQAIPKVRQAIKQVEGK